MAASDQPVLTLRGRTTDTMLLELDEGDFEVRLKLTIDEMDEIAAIDEAINTAEGGRDVLNAVKTGKAFIQRLIVEKLPETAAAGQFSKASPPEITSLYVDEIADILGAMLGGKTAAQAIQETLLAERQSDSGDDSEAGDGAADGDDSGVRPLPAGRSAKSSRSPSSKSARRTGGRPAGGTKSSGTTSRSGSGSRSAK
jgi:hypothetical protein